MSRIRLPHLLLLALAALAVSVAIGEQWLYRRPARSDGRTEIVYWEKWSGFEFDAIRSAVDAYNSGQGLKDRIFVNLINVSQVDRKTMLAIAGGRPPDLAGNWAISVAPFAEKNALTCLDQFIARDAFPLDDYVPLYLETCRYRGKHWALPIVPATTALFYNRRLFREAGLDPDKPPTTIAELDAFAAKIDRTDTRGSLERIGFLHTEPGWWKWAWGYYFGGRITDGAGHVLRETEPWVAALAWADAFAGRYGRGRLASVQSGFGNFDSPQNAFIAEKVGMVIQGVWMPNFINRYNRGLEYGVAPFPTSDGRMPPVTQVETDVITMPTGSPHPEEAWTFMKWLAGPEGAGILCLGQGKHTCLKELPEDFVRRNPNPHVKFFHELAFSRNAYVCGKLPIMNEVRRELGNAFDVVWQGQKTPEEAVLDARGRLQEALDRNVSKTGYVPPAQ